MLRSVSCLRCSCRDTLRSSLCVTELLQVGVTADLVVRCSPAHPAYSLQPALELLQGAGLPVYTACHTHSSLTGPLPPVLHNFLPATATPRATASHSLGVR